MKHWKSLFIGWASPVAAGFLILTSPVLRPIFADCGTPESDCDHITTDYRQCPPLRSATEKSVLREILQGRSVDLRGRAENRLGACFIRYLLTDHSLKIPAAGIIIVGAIIEGQLDLQNLEIAHHFELKECLFKDAVNLRRAHFVKGLSLERSQFGENYQDSNWLI